MPFAGECSRVARVRSFLAFVGGFLCLLWQCPLRGADLDETRQEFIQGHYSNCIHLCQQAIGDQEYNEEWRILLIQSLMTVGQYANARAVLTNNLQRFSSSLSLRLLGREVFFYNDQKENADALLEEVS